MKTKSKTTPKIPLYESDVQRLLAVLYIAYHLEKNSSLMWSGAFASAGIIVDELQSVGVIINLDHP